MVAVDKEGKSSEEVSGRWKGVSVRGQYILAV